MLISYRKYLALLLLCVLITVLASGCSLSQKYPVPNTPEPSSPPQESQTSIPSPAPTPAQEASPSPVPSPVTTDRVAVKGLYLTGWTAGDPKKLEKYIELANTTEINAYVIDIKNDDGQLSYESQVPEVREAGAWVKKYDAGKLIQTLHDNDIYAIGRIVCFRDPIYSKKNPDQAILHTQGGLWRENKKNADYTWLNPTLRENWDYIIAIAREAAELGFDEIQFDYIRFPYGDRSKMVFGSNPFVKEEVINSFIAYAREQLPGVILSADVFGIICESSGDREDIGQNLETIGMKLDYISPMTYPALYAYGQVVDGVKFPNPDLEPYSVVYHSLAKAKRRISAIEGYRADVRPFIQAFTASWIKPGTYQEYGAKQYRQQIQAVYDAGYEQWILWDANNRYDFTAFEKN